MASPVSSSLKRSYDEIGLGDTDQAHQVAAIVRGQPSMERTSGSSGTLALPPSAAEHDRPGFLLLKDTSTMAGSLGTLPTPDNAPVSTTNKRIKLSAAEKDAKRLEKEARDRQRTEDKERKEEEKRSRDAEKEDRRRVKDEQSRLKEEERKLKEEEKKRKDEEKRLKEEEKEKKAKSQLRLNSFFVQQAVSIARSTGSPKTECTSPPSSRRSSITSADVLQATSMGRSTSATPQKPQLPEYERLFLPFFVQPNTALAPYNRFSRDDQGVKYVQSKIDESLSSAGQTLSNEGNIFDPYDLLHLPSRQCKGRGRPRYTVKDIIASMDGSALHPIDLTNSKANRIVKPTERLKSIAVKYLRFAEDVRPPYIGTYTKLQGGHQARKLCKKPFSRALPETNYDYDSEAEWEEPGEGEDLDSEGEEEINEEEEDDEMEGFLDDEEGSDGFRTLNQKRRPIMGDLEPSCTGLCWEDDYEANDMVRASEKNPVNMRTYKLEVILDRPQLPIDPYSTAYWRSTITANSLNTSHPQSQHTSMDPPRVPLNTISRTNMLLPNSALSVNCLKDHNPGKDSPAAVKPHKPPKRFIPPEVMNDFKLAVQGNDLTKAGLVEVLKKQFPKQSKDTIKDTLNLVAERVGSKEADKRWIIKAEYQH